MPLTALPNLTLTITPPGGSPATYTSYLAYNSDQSPSIVQNFGRQGDTAVLPLTDEYTSTPNVLVKTLSQIKLVDNTAGVTLFAGVITNPELVVASPNLNEWVLNCTDYTFYADNAVVFGKFDGLTIDQIIVSLTAQANCGITAATIANGGFVAPAPLLPAYVQNWTTLSDAWRKLATLAGQVTPYGWYVDENRNLHFYDASTAISSGVTFTTTPTAGSAGSLTEGHFSQDTQFSYQWDGTTIHNRILVQGANITVLSPLTGPATDTWQSNGVQTSWPLRYSVSGVTRLLVAGARTTVNTISAGGQTITSSGTTTPWLVQQNAAGQWFLTTTSVPAAGVVIQIWYTYQIPVVAQANDYPSQTLYTGPNNGIYAEYINDTTLTDSSMALARAQRERTEYAFAVERITFNSTAEFFGWVRAGETCTIVNRYIPDSNNSYTYGINDTFLVVANTINFIADGGYRQMEITAVRI